MNQAKLNLEDAGLVCSRNRVELMAGSYLLLTSSPIPSLKSLFINLLKESDLTLRSAGGLSKACSFTKFAEEKSVDIFTGASMENREQLPLPRGSSPVETRGLSGS